MYFLFPKNSPRPWFGILALVAVSFVQFSCSSGSEEEPKPVLPPEKPELSGESKIITFTIAGFDTQAVTSQNVVIVVPIGADVSRLTPTIVVSEGATITPASGVAQNFSGASPVRYTVKAANGTTTQYDVLIDYQDPLQKFSVTISGETYIGDFSFDKKEVLVFLPFTSVSLDELSGFKLTVDATLLKGFSITPAKGATVALHSPVDVQIKNEATGEVKIYPLVFRNLDTDLYSVTLKFPGIHTSTTSSNRADVSFPEYTNGLAASDLVIRVLPGDDLSYIVPLLSYSERASIDPTPTQAQNFADDVTYTVYAEGGGAKSYQVRVVRDDFITSGNGNKNYYESISPGKTQSISYRCSGTITAATLVSLASGKEYSAPIKLWSADGVDDSGLLYFMDLTVPSDTPLGTFRLDVTLKSGDVIKTRTTVRVQ